MSDPFDSVITSNCVECGKRVDLVEAKKWMALAPRNIDDPAYCKDCYYEAQCDECKKEIKLNIQIYCSCESDSGWRPHENMVWCSQKCMEKAHDGPEPEAEETINGY